MSALEPIEDDELKTQGKRADAVKAQAMLNRRKHRELPPRLQVSEGGGIAMCGEEGALAQLRALTSTGLHNANALALVLHQLAYLNPGAINREDDTHINAALALLDELEPEGGTQTMLAVQMVAAHVAAMSCFSRAAIQDQTYEGRELNLKFGTKLSGLYARQAETLSKLKRKGQQTVNVRHVHVYDGGQAVVGNVASSEHSD